MAVPEDIDLDLLLDQSGNRIPKGHDNRALGPGDSSDTGADMAGIAGLDNTSDRQGTGERASVEGEEEVDTPADLAPDDIVDADEAGLGGGLDQAEEAQLGVTDEEIEAALRSRVRRVRD